MDIDAIGLVEKELCQQAATLARMTSCRNAAEIFTKTRAVSASAKGIRNIAQALGEMELNAWNDTRNWRSEVPEAERSPRQSCARKTTGLAEITGKRPPGVRSG